MHSQPQVGVLKVTFSQGLHSFAHTLSLAAQGSSGMIPQVLEGVISLEDVNSSDTNGQESTSSAWRRQKK